jgi:regulator of PEP synthase PpsR (kinase-PPPase family)
MAKRLPITTTLDADLKKECEDREICIADVLDAAVKEILNRVSIERLRELERGFKLQKEKYDYALEFLEREHLEESFYKFLNLKIELRAKNAAF